MQVKWAALPGGAQSPIIRRQNPAGPVGRGHPGPMSQGWASPGTNHHDWEMRAWTAGRPSSGQTTPTGLPYKQTLTTHAARRARNQHRESSHELATHTALPASEHTAVARIERAPGTRRKNLTPQEKNRQVVHEMPMVTKSMRKQAFGLTLSGRRTSGESSVTHEPVPRGHGGPGSSPHRGAGPGGAVSSAGLSAGRWWCGSEGS